MLWRKKKSRIRLEWGLFIYLLLSFFSHLSTLPLFSLLLYLPLSECVSAPLTILLSFSLSLFPDFIALSLVFRCWMCGNWKACFSLPPTQNGLAWISKAVEVSHCYDVTTSQAGWPPDPMDSWLFRRPLSSIFYKCGCLCPPTRGYAGLLG